MERLLLRMAGRDEVRIVKPIFVRDGKPVPVWELAKLKESRKIGVAESGLRSEAARAKKLESKKILYWQSRNVLQR